MQFDYQNPRVRARIEKAMIGINQQKKAMMKQRLTSSVSILFTSPYLIIITAPSAAIPTTTIDQPTISHLKKSDTMLPSFHHSTIPCLNIPFSHHFITILL